MQGYRAIYSVILFDFEFVYFRVLDILKAMNNLIMFLWGFYEEFWMTISGYKRLLVQLLQPWKRF